jgi:hypothetical protein
MIFFIKAKLYAKYFSKKIRKPLFWLHLKGGNYSALNSLKKILAIPFKNILRNNVLDREFISYDENAVNFKKINILKYGNFFNSNRYRNGAEKFSRKYIY